MDPASDRRTSPTSSDAGDDPPILLVHGLDADSDRVVLTASDAEVPLLTELFASRELGVELADLTRSGLRDLVVLVGQDGRSVDDLEDCLEIVVQLLGRCVFGPVGDPRLVDVRVHGRNQVENAVLAAFAPLRRFLPHNLY